LFQGRAETYRSKVMSYQDPVSILAVPSYATGALPAVLAEVGIGMTGQPYELFTFSGHTIVPVKMTFPIAGLANLAGGGAALHGQGVFCGQDDGYLLVTQEDWAINAPIRWVPYDSGITPAPTDSVTVSYERWTLTGQPLHQFGFRLLPSTTTSYKKAQGLESAHC
jgi:hypothetical protein